VLFNQHYLLTPPILAGGCADGMMVAAGTPPLARAASA